MTSTLIFWLGIIIVILFLFFILRKYIGRILILIISLSMIGGIFLLLNPSASKSFFSTLQNLPQSFGIGTTTTGSITTNEEKSEKSETYSRFASLFHKENTQTLGTLITTGSESLLTGENESTEEVAQTPIKKEITISTIEKTDEEIITGSIQIASGEKINYTTDEKGSFLFDANKYAVGVSGDQLVISLKDTSENAEWESNISPNTQEENEQPIEETTISKTPTDKKQASQPTISASKNSLSAEDIREANEIFGK